MIFERLYDDKLAAASYLVGCQATGEALVVDPTRDADRYLKAARLNGLRIAHVTETHIHADFVSGSRELAATTGATLLLSGEGGDDWGYRYAADDGATLLRDGDRFTVGNIQFDVRHTPGHTPEHLGFLVTDSAATDQPIGMLTGDFVFVGAVGRPDLLETAAGQAGTMERSARDLFHSLRRLEALPDHLQLWPAHGAGSACGKGLSSVPQTTLGYERRVSPAFAHDDEAAFVRFILEGQPDPPRYFARMKSINRDGPAVTGGIAMPEGRTPGGITEVVDAGELIIDLQPAAEFASEFIPGSINIPLNRSFPTWAGNLIPYDRDFWLVTRDDVLDEAATDLYRIGLLDRVTGAFTSDVIGAWRRHRGEPDQVPESSAEEAAERIESGDVVVLDVRNPDEWTERHVRGAVHIPLAYLAERLGEIPNHKPLIVHCKSGARSAIAASLLKAGGVRDVTNLSGGIDAWVAAGHPIETADEPTAPS